MRTYQQLSSMKRAVLSLALLFSVLLGGTLAYHLAEGWAWGASLFMTLQTVTTVGLGPVHALTPRGYLITGVLIAAGVAVVAFVFSVLLEELVSRRFSDYFGRKSMNRELSKQCDHVILCGYGRMGELIAQELAAGGQQVVVVDEDAGVESRLEETRHLFVIGDANEEAVLKRAGVEQARALVAALDSDANNLFLTLTARALNPKLKIVARIEESRSGPKLIQAGADRVVSPYVSRAWHIANLLTRPGAVDYIDLVTDSQAGMKLEVSEVEVAADAPYAGKTLAEAHLRQHLGAMVLAVKRAGHDPVFDPGPTTMLQAGDRLILVGRLHVQAEKTKEA